MMGSAPALRLRLLAVASTLLVAGAVGCAGEGPPRWTADPNAPTPPSSPAGGSPATSPSAAVSASPTGSPIVSPSAEPSASASPTAAPSPTGEPSPTAAPAATSLPQGSEPVELDPADFLPGAQHPYWPYVPGTVWTYRETDAEGVVQEVVVEVTQEKRLIAGIEAIVVHDQVTQDGELVEDTFDWYAGDRFGNIWYLGEDTKEYENGEVVSTAGSWEHGVDGAVAGIVMPADPVPGTVYRQEYYAGEAEDMATVMSVTETVTVPIGPDGGELFTDVVMTRDTTPLDPSVVEYKFYAEGVGLILVVGVSPDFSFEQLIQVAGPD